MKLSQLLPAVERHMHVTVHHTGELGRNTEIASISFDSRQVKQGALFVCLTGAVQDGHAFAQDAVARGAVVVLAERLLPIPETVPLLVVPDSREALAYLASTFYGEPSESLRLIGVTGTNGKTTVVHLLAQMLGARDANRCGHMGTLGMTIGGYSEQMSNTTPESLDIQRNLATMRNRGASYAAMEVSSHALTMGRVRGCTFDIGVFTNLTHDHLDYHGTLREYQNAKRLLFSDFLRSSAMGGHAVLNRDDAASTDFAAATKAQVVTYGLSREADVRATDIHTSQFATVFTVNAFSRKFQVHWKLPGLYNVYNALAMIAVGTIYGVSTADMQSTLQNFVGVPGRFETVHSPDGVTVVIDYAHNPDALEQLLQTVRQMGFKRVFCVFGCEGDRDKFKRPVMAQVALDQSDLPILTLDNTRTESPEDILADMVAQYERTGVPSSRYEVIPDRREAIVAALTTAQPGDCVVIAGKGHETVQILGDKAVPFSDREAVEAFWRQEAEIPTQSYGL